MDFRDGCFILPIKDYTKPLNCITFPVCHVISHLPVIIIVKQVDPLMPFKTLKVNVMTQTDSGGDFAQQIALLNLVITTQITQNLAPYEVNASNYFYVMKVGKNPGISKSDFNNLVHLNHSTITRAINQLSKKGLIEQSIDPDDKRSTKLFLTDKGMRLNRGIEQYMQQLNRKLMDRLAPNSDETLAKLVKLRQSIESDHPEQEN
ncbi:MarR family transcriptional regulator [Secundilactobacillus mixtipabuli]|uniref:MarR family transcriptional regulator n=2 Tax=Secundilactobacillus mixtipabuli TaxID=1435342 RepID=A0A1Z5IA21_9LACO|nr:MarR family transcriptional regulator [Secundilactobacillus mixtipabuli]